MATQKQIEANRLNAQKSSGPRSEEGRNKSRLNSLKHGLGAIHVLLPHEDPIEYDHMRQGLVEYWDPVGTQEHMQLNNIVSAYFRIQRASRFEATAMNAQIMNLKGEHGKSLKSTPDDDMAVILDMSKGRMEDAWSWIERYGKRAQSDYYRAIEVMRKLQDARKREPMRQMKEELAHQDYVKKTRVAISHEPPGQMGSFGEKPETGQQAPIQFPRRT